MRISTRASRALLTGSIAGIAGLVLAGGIFAKPVALEADRTFGKGGVTSTRLPVGEHSAAFGLAGTPEGRVVQSVLTMESEFGYVAQYTKRGRLDRSFGDDGLASLKFGDRSVNPRDVLVGTRGTIYVAGEGKSGQSDGYGTALASLRPDGSPNRKFIADGLVLAEALEGVTPLEMAMDRAGRIVIVGQRGGMPAANTVVARFRPGGRLDASFANAGVKVFPVTKNQLGRSVAIDSEGRIVVGSPGGAPYRHEHLIVRLLPNGRFDKRFGGDGRLEIDAVKGYEEITDLAVDSRDRILVTGDTSARGGTVVRLLPGGGIDRKFGSRGVVRFSWFVPRSLTLDGKGRIYALGSDEYAGGEVALLGPNGRPAVTSFVPRTRNLNDGFTDHRNRLVTGGSGSNGKPTVARLLSPG